MKAPQSKMHNVLMATLALLLVGVISGAALWFVVWVLKKVFHLDDHE